MSDYISREQAIDLLKAYINDEGYIEVHAEDLIEKFQELPAMLTGKWKVISDPAEWGTYNATCSNCGERYFFPGIFKGEYYKVCPKCGSRMERE